MFGENSNVRFYYLFGIFEGDWTSKDCEINEYIQDKMDKLLEMKMWSWQKRLHPPNLLAGLSTVRQAGIWGPLAWDVW